MPVQQHQSRQPPLRQPAEASNKTQWRSIPSGGDVSAPSVGLGERRDLDGMFQDVRGLNQRLLHNLFKYLQHHTARTLIMITRAGV